MSDAPNKGLRWTVLFVSAALAVGIFIATFVNTGKQAQTPPPKNENAPVQGKPVHTPAVPTADAGKDAPVEKTADGQPATTPPTSPTATPAASPTASPAATPTPTGPTASAATYAARPVAGAAGGAAATGVIGGLDPAGQDRMKVEFSLNGGGIKTLTLARYFTEIDQKSHVEVQRERASGLGKDITPMGMIGVQVNGRYIDLLSPTLWKETAPGSFEARIYDTATDQDVAVLHRQFTLANDSYTMTVKQSLSNLTTAPMSVRWFQFGPVELTPDSIGYGGDKRRVRFGYLLDASSDPSRQIVLADDSSLILDHTHVIGPKDGQQRAQRELTLWPNPTTDKRGYELVWAGTTNRYFTAIALPLVDGKAANAEKRLTAAATIDRLYFMTPSNEELVPLRISGRETPVAAGGSSDFSMAFYAGPQSKRQIKDEPSASAAGVGEVVLFTFGGICGCCTFPLLTQGLLNLLILLHDYITHDWALAIMLLVVLVRSILHPVTKWSQIRTQRFGKQMQGLQPKMAQIKEKYANDPQRQQTETAKLWREEGINPAGMLGCLPPFLQSPVWIALSAMLFFAIEIRHQPGFFGIFQKMGVPSGMFPYWFMGDLAEPDRLINFHRKLVSLPLMGDITSFNILPILMGVLFYFQQKYMSPPPSATMTPEQEMQMKMMKWMTVVLFPLMMYNQPAGLTLYFFTNSALGILESKWIKRHIDKHDLLNLDKMREERQKKGSSGWMAKLQERAEKARQMQEEAQKRANKNTPPPDRFGRKR